MNEAIKDMLRRYTCKAAGDYEHALREIFQELALLGLWRGRFFEYAAFYGGTALRLLHGLDRFSEDMDFTLLHRNDSFEFSAYIPLIEKELNAWGFRVEVLPREKSAVSAVESAFLKADTREQMIRIDVPESLRQAVPGNQKIKIKVEIDTQPPDGLITDTGFLLQPIPFSVKTGDLPSMFAGKLHALLFRKWKQRVKGRDWYDWVWFVSRGVPVNAHHLTERMRQTGHWSRAQQITGEELYALLEARIDEKTVQAAARDVRPYLKNPDGLAIWSPLFFNEIARKTRSLLPS